MLEICIAEVFRESFEKKSSLSCLIHIFISTEVTYSSLLPTHMTILHKAIEGKFRTFKKIDSFLSVIFNPNNTTGRNLYECLASNRQMHTPLLIMVV